MTDCGRVREANEDAYLVATLERSMRDAEREITVEASGERARLTLSSHDRPRALEVDAILTVPIRGTTSRTRRGKMGSSI